MSTTDDFLAATMSRLNNVFAEIRQETDEELINSLAQDVVATTIKLAAATDATQREMHTQTIRSLYARGINIAAQRQITAARAGQSELRGWVETLVSLLIESALTTAAHL